MRKRGFLLIWFICSALITALPRPAAAQTSGPVVVVLNADGTVAPAMADYIVRGIHTAEQRGAALMVLELNTPGGMIGALNNITGAIRNSTVPVVVYVAPRGALAASAGTIILLSGHAAAMAPETTTGAASPVGSSGQDLSQTEADKTKEFMKAQVREFAKQRGDNAISLAEATIDSAKALTADEALQTGFIDFIATDLNDLLRQMDGYQFQVLVNGQTVTVHTAGAQVETLPLSIIERVLLVLTDANIVFLLLNVGVIAILIEIASPAKWGAGFAGVAMLALATYGLGILNVDWFGLVFMGLAMVLFIVDIKAPTHGALTLAGSVSLVVGALVLFNSPGTPQFERVSVPLGVGVSLMIAAVFFLVLMLFIIPAQRLVVITGQNVLIGQIGVARTDLSPRGNVQVAGELWSAKAMDEEKTIPAGTRVRVVNVEGIQVRVQEET